MRYIPGKENSAPRQPPSDRPGEGGFEGWSTHPRMGLQAGAAAAAAREDEEDEAPMRPAGMAYGGDGGAAARRGVGGSGVAHHARASGGYAGVGVGAGAGAGMGGGAAARAGPGRRVGAGDAGDGYNSDDERGSGHGATYQTELEFLTALWHKRRWQVIKMREDGACLFRSVAYHVFGDAEMHGQVRQLCMDYMERNRDHYSGFITEDFDAYIQRKRHEREHGNHVEIQAISEMYNRSVEVYQYSDEPLNIFQAAGNTDAPIRLLYHGNHYDAIIDPARPTFGVGLGFTDLRPGEADRRQLAAAEEASVADVLAASAMRQSDVDMTEAELEAAILAQSRLEYEQETLRRFQGSSG